jgi:hypothetical protein
MTVNMETVRLIGKVGRIWHALFIKCTKYFFLADILFLGGSL